MNSWSNYNRIRQQKICCAKGPQGDVGPPGPSGLDVSGVSYSDYLYWNDSSGSWQVGSEKVHIGRDAGKTTQSENAIAIGRQAGEISQGTNSIAIGNLAGQTDQTANSIILNASDVSLNSNNSGLFINPITKVSTDFPLFYNNGTKEVTSGPLFGLQQFTIFKSFSSSTNLSSNIINRELTLNDGSNVVMGDSIQLLQYSIETNLDFTSFTSNGSVFGIEISDEELEGSISLINDIQSSSFLPSSTNIYNFLKNSIRDNGSLGTSVALNTSAITTIVVKLKEIESSEINTATTLDARSDIYFRINLLCKLTYDKTLSS